MDISVLVHVTLAFVSFPFYLFKLDHDCWASSTRIEQGNKKTNNKIDINNNILNYFGDNKV